MSAQPEDFGAILRDGSQVTVRPLQPGDVGLEREFIGRLSAQSRRFRFLDSFSSPSEDLLHRLTHLDASREAAFLALVTEKGVQKEVGVARLAAVDGKRAEYAVVVRDDWQGRGLGTLLTKRVIDEARRRGLHTLFSVDAHDNYAMRDLALHLGFERTMNPEDATEVIHTLHLAP